MNMISYYTKRSKSERFERLRQPIKHGMWLDGSNLIDEEIAQLVSDFELDPNIVYDVRDAQELSRVEFKGENEAYVFLRAPRLANSGRIAAGPLLCIIKDDNFFSLSRHETYSPETIASSSLRNSTENTTDLLIGVIAECVSSYQELIGHTERSINDTGSRLKSHEVTNQDFIHFVTVEDNLTAYRINLDGVMSVVTKLKESTKAVIDPNSHEALDDITLQIKQLLVAVESYGRRVESIRNAYSTIANNTLNLRMKTLTVFTVLITVPNVFYGMFGMNISLPLNQDEPWAFAALVGGTFLLTFLIFIIARWRRLF